MKLIINENNMSIVENGVETPLWKLELKAKNFDKFHSLLTCKFQISKSKAEAIAWLQANCLCSRIEDGIIIVVFQNFDDYDTFYKEFAWQYGFVPCKHGFDGLFRRPEDRDYWETPEDPTPLVSYFTNPF